MDREELNNQADSIIDRMVAWVVDHPKTVLVTFGVLVVLFIVL